MIRDAGSVGEPLAVIDTREMLVAEEHARVPPEGESKHRLRSGAEIACVPMRRISDMDSCAWRPDPGPLAFAIVFV